MIKLKLNERHIGAIRNILLTLESPHTSFHIDGASHLRLAQSKQALVEVIRYIQEQMAEANKMEPVGLPKPLKDEDLKQEIKEEAKEEKKDA